MIWEDLLGIFKLFDSPGTYIMMIVLGMVLVPYYIKNIQMHLTNPQEYYMMSFEKKFFIGLIIISFLIIYGLVNFMRFMK